MINSLKYVAYIFSCYSLFNGDNARANEYDKTMIILTVTVLMCIPTILVIFM